jgi:hypothetical protein
MRRGYIGTSIIIAVLLGVLWLLVSAKRIVDNPEFGMNGDQAPEVGNLNYINTIYNYRITYPEDFKLVAAETASQSEMKRLGLIDGDVLLIERYSPKGDNVTYIITSPSVAKPEISFDKYVETLRTNLNQNSLVKEGVISERLMQIGDERIKAVELSFEVKLSVNDQPRKGIVYTTVFGDDRQYFALTFSVSNGKDYARYVEIYRGILESFSFLE